MAGKSFLVFLCVGFCFGVFQPFSTAVVGTSLEDGGAMSGSRSYFDEISELTRYKFTFKKMENGIDSKHYNYDGANDIQSVSLTSTAKWQPHFQDVLHFLDILNGGKSRSNFFEPMKSKVLEILDKIENIESAKNGGKSPRCINDTEILIKTLLSGYSTSSSWAFQFLDAAGKPGPSITKGWLNFVGSYDQCIKASAVEEMDQFQGRYFTIPLSIPGSPFPAKFGICFPSSCSSKQVTALFQDLLSVMKIKNCHVGNATQSTAETKVTAATIIAIIILLILGILSVLGTFYDVLVVQSMVNLMPGYLDTNGNNPESGSSSMEGHGTAAVSQRNSLTNETQPLIPKTVTTNASPNAVGKILLAFSLYSNGKKVLNTSQAAGSLGSIHGIRFLSMTWVVLGHCYAFGALKFTLNAATELPILIHRWTFDAVVNALVSVDTFFALSGLLTSYVTLPVLWRHGLKINWAKFYFHRFWRLTPPYMCALVIVLGFQQYLGQGPFWGPEQPYDKKFCEKNWWTNLLYVNNLVNTKEMCFGHAWYLANDMQFFIISPIMLIPFYFHWAAGIATCAGVLLISWITTSVLSYQNEWGVTIFSVILSLKWFDNYYIVPWCRIGPYIVGILAGYALAVYKERPFRMKQWVVIVGWLLATGTALAVLYGVHGDISGEHPSTRSLAALYNTVGRSLWGACVCWVIVACALGYGGPVNALLSWSPFVMLGRLTYMTYLIHICIIQVFFGSMGSLYYMNDTSLPLMFLGLLVFSNMVAFVGVLFLESPMIGLEKVLLRKERPN